MIFSTQCVLRSGEATIASRLNWILSRWAKREAIDAAIDRAKLCFPAETPRVVAADPADDMLLAAAVEGEADALVTNDAEVLNVGTYRGVLILRPTDFLNQFRN